MRAAEAEADLEEVEIRGEDGGGPEAVKGGLLFAELGVEGVKGGLVVLEVGGVLLLGGGEVSRVLEGEGVGAGNVAVALAKEAVEVGVFGTEHLEGTQGGLGVGCIGGCGGREGWRGVESGMWKEFDIR